MLLDKFVPCLYRSTAVDGNKFNAEVNFKYNMAYNEKGEGHS